MKFITIKDPYLLLVLSLIRAATWFRSQRLTLFIVNSIAFLAYRVSRAKRRLSEKNLAQAFGKELSKDRIRKIVRLSFRQFWLDTFAVPGSGIPEAALQSAAIRGLEHLRSALSDGKGAILWESSYFGERLLAKQILHKNGFRITQVHADNHMGGFGGGTASRIRERFVRSFFENCEKPFVREIVYLTSPESLAFTKDLAQRLKRNEILCISADGRRGHSFVAVPFLGQTVSFPTGILSLAKLTGAPILPLICLQEKREQITLVIDRPIQIDVTEDRKRGFRKAATRYTSLLESYVKAHPEQYRNWHGLAPLQRPEGDEGLTGAKSSHGAVDAAMQDDALKHWYDLSRLGVLIALVVALGLFFRFIDIDKKVYWGDETFTSLRLSGHWAGKVKREIFTGREISSHDLQHYQRTSPARGILSTLISIGADDPKHPPLYDVLLRMWVSLWGDSVAGIRSLSAVASVLALFCIYFLSRELFESPGTGWLAVALTAVSPFHVLYAQEARAYSLWTFTIILSSAAFLRAIRAQTRIRWSVYAATLALGLYTHALFALVMIAHAAYFGATMLPRADIKNWPKLSKNFCLASVLSLMAFAPWAAVIVFRLPQVQANTAWVTGETSFFYLTSRWILGLSSLFIDVNSDAGSWLGHGVRLPVVLLIGYSLYFVCRSASRRVRFFILVLIASNLIPLIIPDLLFGGRRSASPRFWIPCYIGVQLSAAYLLAAKMKSSASSRRNAWRATTILLITGGIVSCAISSQAETWWNKGRQSTIQAARVINRSARPTVISNSAGINFSNVLALSYLVEPKVRFLLTVDPEVPEIPGSFRDVFLFDPAGTMRLDLKTRGITLLEPVHPPALWQIKQDLSSASAMMRKANANFGAGAADVRN